MKISQLSSYMTSDTRICVTFRTSSNQFMNVARVQKAHKVLKKEADMTVDTSCSSFFTFLRPYL